MKKSIISLFCLAAIGVTGSAMAYDGQLILPAASAIRPVPSIARPRGWMSISAKSRKARCKIPMAQMRQALNPLR
ncbi:hypothetical protein [Atlantibacter subterraneus]|uniref:hypothetical protein n=1 Tax=Atlantibacter subterraneus TaxID=255519 RepID=UPI0029649860|nr:hypothetical protein [Atlantibacter subterranea]MDW2742552.1 hypothetical protein [Atlantibacter subterranea]